MASSDVVRGGAAGESLESQRQFQQGMNRVLPYKSGDLAYDFGLENRIGFFAPEEPELSYA